MNIQIPNLKFGIRIAWWLKLKSSFSSYGSNYHVESHFSVWNSSLNPSHFKKYISLTSANINNLFKLKVCANLWHYSSGSLAGINRFETFFWQLVLCRPTRCVFGILNGTGSVMYRRPLKATLIGVSIRDVHFEFKYEKWVISGAELLDGRISLKGLLDVVVKKIYKKVVAARMIKGCIHCIQSNCGRNSIVGIWWSD